MELVFVTSIPQKYEEVVKILSEYQQRLQLCSLTLNNNNNSNKNTTESSTNPPPSTETNNNAAGSNSSRVISLNIEHPLSTSNSTNELDHSERLSKEATSLLTRCYKEIKRPCFLELTGSFYN